MSSFGKAGGILGQLPLATLSIAMLECQYLTPHGDAQLTVPRKQDRSQVENSDSVDA